MTPPAVSDFKAQFNRDFPFGGTNGDLSTVQDSDIQRALDEAGASINPDLFSGDPAQWTAYLYLAAHNLVVNLRNSSQGLSGSFSWLVTSKGVGSVSVGYSFPESIQKSPVLAALALTQYGAKYLTLIAPALAGGMGVAGGMTQA